MNKPTIEVSDFGEVGKQNIKLYTVKFLNRLEASLTNYGGILTHLRVPDKNGVLEDVVAGYDNLDSYLNETPYFGAIVGRYANRIANGRFELNGEVFKLPVNNGPNHLHGGLKGFDKIIWEAETKVTNESVELVLNYVSQDGEEGFPGTLKVKVTYTFTETGFTIAYKATTDKPTVLNLTQHSYFNLSGDFNSTILDHELLIRADQYLPVNEHQIPTGQLEKVGGTPFDFTQSKQVGRDINITNQQLEYGSGYDHCWVFDERRNMQEEIASLCHKPSGRCMEVFTTEPGVQLYTGNFLENTIPGKGGILYQKRSALCLETQHFPDSPNKPEFPTVALNPGGVFESQTTYKFSVR